MHNKTIIEFGFCDMQNYQGLGKRYQPRLRISQKPHPIIVNYTQILGMLESYRPAMASSSATSHVTTTTTQILHRSLGNYGVEVSLSLQSRQELQWLTPSRCAMAA
jgi:hypothetical protein